MMANDFDNIGERAEQRRVRQQRMLIGTALVAAAIQLGTALVRQSSPDHSVPVWLTVIAAASVAGLMLLLFRMGERSADEFKLRRVAAVATAMMKALFIGYPAWLLLQAGGLVPELSAIQLFGALTAVMFISLIWTRMRE